MREREAIMWSVRRSVEVLLPVGAAYARWVEFEGLPRWLADLHGVRQLRYTRFCWRADGATGGSDPWDVQISVDASPRRIVWSGLCGGRVRTRVCFDGRSGGTTQIRMTVSACDLAGLASAGTELARVFAAAGGQVRGSLERFRELVDGGRKRPGGPQRAARRSAARRSRRLRLVPGHRSARTAGPPGGSPPPLTTEWPPAPADRSPQPCERRAR
jgi:uncharacterized membrane protein